MKLDAANYWDNRYQTQDTGWDLGEISPKSQPVSCVW